MARTSKVSKKRAQQLKHDKFRDATMGAFDRLGNRLEGRGRRALYVVGALLALGLLFGLYRTWSHSRAERASLALGKAIEIWNAPVTTGTPPPGRTGPTFTSEREKAQRAVEEFQKVAAEYGDPYREMAKFFIAVNMLQVERAQGLEQLTALTRSGNEEVAGRAKFALAQAKEATAPGEDRDRQLEEAVALYAELLRDKDSPVPPDTLNFRIAAVRERQGRKDEAADILFKLVEESRKSKGKDGRAASASSTAREASTRLKALSPERFAQLTPETAGKPELPF